MWLLPAASGIAAEDDVAPAVNSTAAGVIEQLEPAEADSEKRPLDPAGQDAPADGPATEEADPGSSRWDRYHESVGDRLHKPIIWFDDFFGDPRSEEEISPPSSFIRLRNRVLFTEGEGFTFPIRLHANIRVPKATERLRLIITGENEDELENAQPATAAAGLTDQQTDNTNVGLRYIIFTTLRDRFHLGGGIQGLPVEYYVRIRYRRLMHIGRKNIFRFTETGFWHSQEQLGETSRLDFERTHTPLVSSRFSVYGTYSETSEGMDWGVEQSIFLQLSTKSAFSFDLGMSGDTRPHTEINNYRVGCRYRRNFYRPWLFYEVAPEVSFPLEENGSRSAVGGLMLVLEVQFLSDEED